jgi:large subunit ribosomal protein L23
MKDPRQVILRPIISERSYDLIEQNRYTFEVAKQASKIEIGQAVESIFGVTVLKVNTMNVSGKPKRVRYAKGTTRSWKKAIVTLAAGQTIEAFGV